jgi:hypothetical protein
MPHPDAISVLAVSASADRLPGVDPEDVVIPLPCHAAEEEAEEEEEEEEEEEDDAVEADASPAVRLVIPPCPPCVLC